MKKIILSLAFLQLCNAAHATVLTFDGAETAPNGWVDDDYGTRVTATTDGVFSYGEGPGFTPNVEVSYSPSIATPFRVYFSGYENQVNALGHSSFDVPGEVVLSADPGWLVTLNKFDVGSWGTNGPFGNSRIRVLDGSGAALFDTGLFTVFSNQFFNYNFPTPLTAEVLRIAIDDFGDLALDNVTFGQTPVPLPAPILLLGAGILGLLRFRHRVG